MRLPFDLKVLHKSLLLVLVPLVIQTIFFFQLAGVVSRAEQATAAERKQSNISEHINWLMAEFAATLSGFATYAVTGRQPFAEKGKASMMDMNRQFDELERLLADSPKELAQVKNLRQMTSQQFKQIEGVQPVEDQDSATFLYTHIGEFRHSLKEARKRCLLLITMMGNEKKELETVRSTEASVRHGVQEQIYIGLVGNFILVGLLLTWFINNITSRLSVLVENARMLPSGVALDNKVGGRDELAYLDRVLHRAAEDLRDAADHRQALMEMVAHDLRSPLMSCQVSMQILASDKIPTLPPVAVKQIASVQGNLTRVVDLVSDLLTLDKLEAGQLDLEREPFDVQLLADEAVDSLSALAREKQIVLVNECQPITLVADRKRILQVLINLLSNAIKFSPSASSVKISSSSENSVIILSVEDRGPGISRADRDRVFSKFFQTDTPERVKGFGLGLAICRMLVEAHDGHIGVDSDPGKGSRFWLQLPLKPKLT